MNAPVSIITTTPFPPQFYIDEHGNHFLVAHRTARVKKSDRKFDDAGNPLPLPSFHVPIDALAFDCILKLWQMVAAHRPDNARMVILTNRHSSKVRKLHSDEGHVELRLWPNGCNITLSRFIGDAAHNEQMAFHPGKHGVYLAPALIVKRLRNKVPVEGDDRKKRPQHDARARLIVSALDASRDFQCSEYSDASALSDMHAMFDICDKMDMEREAKPAFLYQVHDSAKPRQKPARPKNWRAAIKAHPSKTRAMALAAAKQ